MFRKRYSHDQYIAGIESKISGVGLKERAHGGSGTREQQDGERDLTGDEHGADASAPGGGGARVSSLKCAAEMRIGELQRGREAGEDSRCDGDGDAEEKHRQIDGDDDFVRDGILRQQTDDEVNGKVGNGDTQGRAGD